MSRVALFAPGRGSYGEKSLRSLDPQDELVRAAEDLRAGYGLESLVALDSAPRFEPARHLRPANAAALIYLCTMLDSRAVLAREDVVCVGGNSLGWYTALAIGGALTFEDGFRLVQEMALLQEAGEPGGQLIYPVMDAEWRRDPIAEAAVAELLASTPGELFPSIALGGYAVLAGTNAGVARALTVLPKVKLGATTYPFKLAQHGPYHTPLASSVAARARAQLGGLAFRAPSIALVDGRGVRISPHSCDVEALRAYTLGAQVDTPYDFTASVRTAMHEHAPERLVLPGPGNSLGGPCAQVLIRCGWRGLHAKSDFERVQASDRPVIESLRR